MSLRFLSATRGGSRAGAHCSPELSSSEAARGASCAYGVEGSKEVLWQKLVSDTAFASTGFLVDMITEVQQDLRLLLSSLRRRSFPHLFKISSKTFSNRSYESAFETSL